MTTEIVQLGWRDLRVVYQGRMNGEESATNISKRLRSFTTRWALRLAYSRVHCTSSFTRSTFIVELRAQALAVKVELVIRHVDRRRTEPIPRFPRNLLEMDRF
jgi:hypothetical protein